MNADLIERANAMIAEAVARSQSTAIAALHLTIYLTPESSLDAIRAAIDAARRGTAAEQADLCFHEAPARYICWNCCGLRFAGWGGICPNCGGEALIVPEEIVFALSQVEAAGQ